MYRPTPRDVLWLLWCPRYLWFARRVGVWPSERMRAGREAEEAARPFIASALGAEPRRVYVDAGWFHGEVDLVARGAEASPIEIKLGPARREHRYQLYAEALLLREGLGYAVRAGYIYYVEEGRLERVRIGAEELGAARRLLRAAARVVEGAAPPVRPSAKCSYCEYRNLCPLPRR